MPAAHSVLLNARAWAQRHPFLALLLLVLVIWFPTALIFDNPPPRTPETLEQAQARVEKSRGAALAAEKAGEDQRQQADITRRQCLLKSVCAKYAAVRQECAVAGDFKNCIQVRMGKDADEAYWCTTDGSIVASKIPNTVECWWSKASDWLSNASDMLSPSREYARGPNGHMIYREKGKLYDAETGKPFTPGQ